MSEERIIDVHEPKFDAGEIVKVVGDSYKHCIPLGMYVRIQGAMGLGNSDGDFLVEELTPSEGRTFMVSQIISEDCLEKADSLVDRLKIRAMIRRQAQDRKSVQEGKSDRLADLLDEAAHWISVLESENAALSNQDPDERY
jgi:hypothetical protein